MDSSFWKSIIALKPLALKLMCCKVNDGRSTNFLYDTWMPFGQLITFNGQFGLRDFNFPKLAYVRDASSSTGWKLPSPRSDNSLALHIYLTTFPLSQRQNSEYSYKWIVGSQNCKGFSSSKTLDALQPWSHTKQWSNTVWFSGAIPRQVFKLWLANLNMLPTKVRKWLLGV